MFKTYFLEKTFSLNIFQLMAVTPGTMLPCKHMFAVFENYNFSFFTISTIFDNFVISNQMFQPR